MSGKTQQRDIHKHRSDQFQMALASKLRISLVILLVFFLGQGPQRQTRTLGARFLFRRDHQEKPAKMWRRAKVKPMDSTVAQLSEAVFCLMLQGKSDAL